MVIQDFGVGGGKPPDIRNIIQDSCSGEPLVWIGELGDEPQDLAYPWKIAPQDGPPFGGNESKARHDEVTGVL